jgi:starch-binding outer membrane protein, SusD/RagB family
MKRIFIVSVCILGALLGTQCDSDFLNRTPPGVGSVEGFYKTEGDLIAGINGVYQSFQGDWWGGAFIHLQPHLDGATDNGKICCAWEYEVKAIASGTMNPNTGGFVNWKWTFGYQAITRINQLLQVIEQGGLTSLSEEKSNKWEAELKFLRAFVYSQLIFYYGDVPLILKPITPVEAKELTRTPKNEVLTQVISDLDFAIANLSVTPNEGQFGRPTKQLALAIKGKVYLYEGKWAEAANALSDIILLEGSAVILDPNYESLFRGNNEQSKEIMFSIQYVGIGQGASGKGEGQFIQTHYAPIIPGEEGAGWQSLLHTNTMRDKFYMLDGLSINNSPLYNPDSVFERRDPRLGQTFYITGYRKAGANDSVPYSTYRGFPMEQDYLEHQGERLTQIPGAAKMGTKKWVAEFDNTSFSENFSTDLVLVRYADVLLMYAEAQNEAIGPDASVYQAVNKVRARVGMPNFPTGLTKEQMRQEIRHERDVEFAMEGMRYNDLLRWRIAETILPSFPAHLENRVFDPAKHYLWPIPQTVIDSNPLIKQNPGY